MPSFIWKLVSLQPPPPPSLKNTLMSQDSRKLPAKIKNEPTNSLFPIESPSYPPPPPLPMKTNPEDYLSGDFEHTENTSQLPKQAVKRLRSPRISVSRLNLKQDRPTTGIFIANIG